MVVAGRVTPGKLLCVTRRWRRGVLRKLRLAVEFLVSLMGGALVRRGNVMMGDLLITLCSSSRAAF
jgi:hypothetical protein